RLADIHSRETERLRDLGPRLLLWRGCESHELDLRARLAAEVREIALEDAEVSRPSLLDVLELMVPVVRAREPAMDDAHAARSAGLRLARTFGRQRGCARAHAVLVLGRETARRIPLLDLRLRLHAGPEVHDQGSLFAFLEPGGDEPRRQPRSRRDRLPDFF